MVVFLFQLIRQTLLCKLHCAKDLYSTGEYIHLNVLPDAAIAQSRFDDKFALNVNFFSSDVHETQPEVRVRK